MDTNLLVTLGILLLLAIAAAALLMRRKRSDHLADRFGPEYERTVERMGSRGKAEADLAAREKRVHKLEIVPLAAQEAQRFRAEWQTLQSRFVDSPRTAMTEADLLVRDLMTRRGYPVADFETRAADALSSGRTRLRAPGCTVRVAGCPSCGTLHPRPATGNAGESRR